MTRKKRETCGNAIAWAVMVRELQAGHCTAFDLMNATGLSHETILGYVRALRRQNAIYVAAWVEDSNGRRRVAAYALGDKSDARRTPEAPSVTKARYRMNARRKQLANAIAGAMA